MTKENSGKRPKALCVISTGRQPWGYPKGKTKACAIIALLTAGGALSCYLYEQIFFEAFIGSLRSVYRNYELIFVLCGFFGFCVVFPAVVLRYRADYFPIVITSNVVIPLSFVTAVSFTDLCFYLGKPLYVESSLMDSDVIVISDRGNFHIRCAYAARLYHQGYAEKIVTFAGRNKTIDEALEDQRIPRDAIIDGRTSEKLNTRAEALILKNLVGKYEWCRILLISDAFHMYRLIGSLSRIGVKNIAPAGVPEDLYRSMPARFLGLDDKSDWNRSFSSLSVVQRLRFRHRFTLGVMHEYVGIGFYWLLDYI